MSGAHGPHPIREALSSLAFRGARDVILAMGPRELEELNAAVNAHEEELDCSDGPNIALQGPDAVAMREAFYTCCGWEETLFLRRTDARGRYRVPLVIGSCYGH